MITMPTVYEGKEAIRKLQRTPYFESIRVKFIMTDSGSGRDKKSFHWKAMFGEEHLFMSIENTWDAHFFDDMFHDNDIYIATVCPLFHSQFLQVRVLALNFNVSKKQMIQPWCFMQTSYGQMFSKEIHFNEEGCPIYNDLMEDVYMKPVRW